MILQGADTSGCLFCSFDTAVVLRALTLSMIWLSCTLLVKIPHVAARLRPETETFLSRPFHLGAAYFPDLERHSKGFSSYRKFESARADKSMVMEYVRS